MFGGSSVVLWICPLTHSLARFLARLVATRLLAHHSPLVRSSFCDQSHSGTNEREPAASARSGGSLAWFRRRLRRASIRCPCHVTRRRRPSSCVTVASVVAATFSEIKVALPHFFLLRRSPSRHHFPSLFNRRRRRRRRHVFARRIWPSLLPSVRPRLLSPQLPRSPHVEGMWPPPSVVRSVGRSVSRSACLSVASNLFHNLSTLYGSGRARPWSPLTTSGIPGHSVHLFYMWENQGNGTGEREGERERGREGGCHVSLFLQRAVASISILHHHL